ncbi:MAG: Group-specific protein [Candidatus Yanofskybacteria bacterium GW2011_GWD2_39_48]|uniref:Group-specific protein n=1 Tax=Candidatus Yanofskybacteria bacterium GW2011_GWD2_39_48 TaxID=1619031 RepID=A0A0G0PFK3_9BACT|nr:MAG: Group-specific protein [Candidatus Yanofskybacteria bacterium GW2011_GWD2_39_48]
MKRVYAEVGFGNKEFLSTEIEENDNEYRISSFNLPKNIDDYYLRVWILRTVMILSTKDGIKIAKKKKNRFKLIFGIGGEDVRI